EVVAFGFLCGRDFNTKEYIKNKADTFNLVKEHKKIFTLSNTPKRYKTDKTIGIPEALFLAEEGVLWKHFFNTLEVKVISSSGVKEPIKEGKKITSAEFCAPVTAFIGHVSWLADKADYIFLPIYLETRDKENPKKYCYFTQYVSSLAASIESLHLEGRTIIQVIDRRDFVITSDLVRVLKPIIKSSYWAVYFAYHEALSFYKESKEKLKNIFKREFERTETISVVFLGRPYTILDPGMNKHIPTLFENLKIKAFYQDMLSYEKADTKEIHDLLGKFHWHYASKILESALIAAKTDGLYPVYITSFKCGPDSFAIEYFKRIMDSYNKPYLILQLDEHDSSVGYETRVEAAVRSFQNHYGASKEEIIKKSGLPVNPVMNKNIGEKILLIPCWDHINIKLIEAVLLRSGIDARMVPLTEQAIQNGPSTNTGMCIPVNIIAQSLIDYIEIHDLEPENISVWVFESNLACNIKMYPYFIKSVFESYGKNMEKVSIYLGDFTFKDFSPKITVEAFFAHYFGGMLRRMGCRIRPYEKKKGTTDKVIEQSLQIFYNTFLGNRNKKRSVKKVVHLFKKIKTIPGKRQQIAIFGDMYVRDNEIMNQDLIRFIEENGGEVVITPLSEMVKVMANIEVERSLWAGTYTDALSVKLLISFIATLEKNYSKYFSEILHEPPINWEFDYKKVLRSYKVKIGQNGESSDNLLILNGIKNHYPGIRLFVQTMPAFCSAGIVTEEMNGLIEKTTGIPVVTLNYDGTHKNQNEKLIPYMKFYK
ncbi:MAG: hypothetical protein JXJ04_11345, partial [Spirochaetales bacterium]|nr:hypothetical protein [Spirochaetales bacterium]